MHSGSLDEVVNVSNDVVRLLVDPLVALKAMLNECCRYKKGQRSCPFVVRY